MIFADNGKKIKRKSALRKRDAAACGKEILPSAARKNGTRCVPFPHPMCRACDQAFAFFHASTLALLIWVSFSAVYLDSAPPLV